MTHVIHKGCRAAALGLALALGFSAAPAGADLAQIPDGSDDAYRVPGATWSPPAAQPPSALLSDPVADIVSGTFATVSPGRSYSAAMEISGTPSGSYNYYVAGQFGTDCYLYHYLTPGRTAVANAFCGPDHTFAGSISGSPVVQTGRRLSATFKYQSVHLPAELRADPQLRGLFAYTCTNEHGSRSCPAATVLDWAEAAPGSTFRI